jgi:hypothetical protein
MGYDPGTFIMVLLYVVGIKIMARKLSLDWSYRNLIITWILVPIPLSFFFLAVSNLSSLPFIIKSALWCGLGLILNFLFWKKDA